MGATVVLLSKLIIRSFLTTDEFATKLEPTFSADRRSILRDQGALGSLMRKRHAKPVALRSRCSRRQVAGRSDLLFLKSNGHPQGVKNPMRQGVPILLTTLNRIVGDRSSFSWATR